MASKALDKIFAAMNAENPVQVAFSPNNVTLSIPVPDVDNQPGVGDEWNTMVRVTAKVGSAYTGWVDVFYRRVDLNQLGNVGLMQEARMTMGDLLNALNVLYPTDLEMEEPEFDAVDMSDLATGIVHQIPLSAKPNSYGWTGDNNLLVVFGIPAKAGELHELLHTILPAPGYL